MGVRNRRPAPVAPPAAGDRVDADLRLIMADLEGLHRDLAADIDRHAPQSTSPDGAPSKPAQDA